MSSEAQIHRSSVSNTNEDGTEHSHTGSSKLDLTKYFYYQNPVNGSVSSNARSTTQLVKLLIPVREGMSPILSAQTLCLPIPSSSGGDEEQQQQQQNTFGEWKPASSFDILKEAACAHWYINDPLEQPPQTHGPIDCRKMLEVIDSSSDQSKIRYFAAEITKDKWITIDELPGLKVVLDILRHQNQVANEIADETCNITNSKDNNIEEKGTMDDTEDQDVKEELEKFLSSTEQGDSAERANGEDHEDHEYESDGGTRYVKDPFTGNWIHEALADQMASSPAPEGANLKPKPEHSNAGVSNTTTSKKRKNKKAKFSKRNARQWIYVSGLPTSSDVSIQDLVKFFSKAGMLDIDPENMKPKVKVYRNTDGTLKGDASICYARAESVELALQILDESPWDDHHIVKVERAKFEAKGDSSNSTEGDHKRKRAAVSEAQRKVVRLALRQAQDDGFGDRLAGGRKGLRIVVVKRMLDGIPERHWEDTIQSYIENLTSDNTANPPEVEKITCISKNRVVLIKFAEPSAASTAVEKWHGQPNESGSAQMEAIYWDGVTNYTHQDEEEKEKEEQSRLNDFGKWLENQDELPPELRLQVAED